MSEPANPVVVLLRHGATEWSEAGRHTGRTDVPLTAEGEAQAKAVAGPLAAFQFGLVLSSPLARARATAELAGLPGIEFDPDLQEWDYGGYEGLTSAQIRERRPGWSLWRDGVVASADGRFETAADVGKRADRVIARVLAWLGEQAGHAGGADRDDRDELAGAAPSVRRGRDVALVAHGHYLRVLGARWVGFDPAAGSRLALDTATISMLGFEHGERVIRAWNVRAWNAKAGSGRASNVAGQAG